ncbi:MULTISPECIES: toprim domain-containing protein [Muribaculaceae]|jgi:DNA primase|uniref:toprim domain-containing protein n=1 Tax=Muribaculaceae TaxID=2005473 RepID=UPI00244E1757|nr:MULTISPECIES: toprim domain-containing protein [Bacteroidales]
MNIDQIKKISLVEFLNQLGYQPTGRDSKGLWFHAPYRSERKPSFHVNLRKNVWYDFGTGAGGDIFSLAGEMSGETDFLRQADYIAEKMRLPVASSSERRFATAKNPYKPTPFVEEPTFENVKVSRLTSPALLKYLADRGIPRDIAQRYCVQVDYQLHGKDYYAIGFENNAHGYELRNPFFKGSYPPKHITHIANGNARCNVFEGFIDFLSAERLGINDGMDSVVLNSVANVTKAITPLADYTVIQCYLDNDAAGRAALARLRREFGDRVMDKSALYPDNKDLNDYLMSLYPKKSSKLKL